MIEIGLTFMFVVGELPVRHSEPSLFKVFLAKAFPPLGTFLYLPITDTHKMEAAMFYWKQANKHKQQPSWTRSQ